MLTSEYSPLKIIHHPGALETLRRGSQIVPLHVELVISDLCNQDCSFCAYRMSGYSSNQLFGITRADGTVNNNPPRMITYPKVLEILDDCQAMGVKAVQITGGGEPTVHPQHAQIFKAVLDRNMKLAVVSNAAKISEQCQEQLARASWVRFSLDAGSESTYASMRRVSPEVFQRVLDNIRGVVNARDRTARVGISFVVTAENYREIVKAAAIARDLGVDNFRISAVFTPEGPAYFRDFWDDAQMTSRAAEKMATDTFVVHNSLGERMADLTQRPEYRTCYQQQVSTYIGADLNVYRCCVQSYNEHGLLGSLKDQSFLELWQGDEKRAKIGTFDARSCERCSFNVKNRVLNYAVIGEQPDVEFT